MIVNNWRLSINTHQLSLTENIVNNDLIIRADRSALTRLFNILIDNAVKYTPSPGHINIQLANDNGNAVFTITDTGIGINPEDHQQIFERFYRVDKARSREQGGAGLGLAIARWIVEQHNGTIRVKSDLGQGTQFTVVFPYI